MTQRRDISGVPPSMKVTQLLPIKIENRLETSVYGIAGCKMSDIRAMCQDWIDEAAVKSIAAKQNPRNCYGYAKIGRETLNTTNLELDIDNNPLGHANIIGWPLEYEDRLEIVNELKLLAAKFSPRVTPNLET